MELTITNLNIESIGAFIGLIAFSWSAFQELRHKSKFGNSLKFRQNIGTFCPKCGVPLSSKRTESREESNQEVLDM